MATLQKIRNRAGLLIAIVIGLALLAFILGDILSSNSSLFTGNQFEIGKVKRKAINYKDYLAKVEELTQLMKINSGRSSIDQSTNEYIRQQVWDQMVEDIIYKDEFKSLGIGVSSEELYDLIQGDNPHYFVRQMFTNPQTGELRKSDIINFWKSLDQDETGERMFLANYIENMIVRQRTIQKYNMLASKGLYVTNLEAKNGFVVSSGNASIKYIAQRYSDIPDSSVTITEKELKNYYNNHKNKYKQTESRDLAYVSFNIIPSEEDNMVVKKQLDEIKDEFIRLKDVEQFVKLHSDEGYSAKYYKVDELPDVLRDSIYYAEEGFVYGPYFENESFKLAKLISKQPVPDSVNARHILIQPNQERTLENAKELADSLENVIRKGGNFESLANRFSDDPGSREKGGDLGWFTEGQMVKSFNDACFEGKKGDVTVIKSDYGYHIIEILDQGTKIQKLKIVFIEQKVLPGKQTIQAQYAKAVEFAAGSKSIEDFDKKVNELNLNKRIANNVTKSAKVIQGVENSRSIIQWMYKAKVGSISEIFELDNSFIVGALTKVREDGFSDFEDVKSGIEFEVKKEKKGEIIAEKIKEKMKDVSSISDLASAMATVVKEAENITFSTYAIPGLGAEPKINAYALNYEENKLSKPIKGATGVYVVEVTKRAEADVDNMSLSRQKERLTNELQSRTNYKPLEVLKDKANIKDNRINFF